MALMDIVRGFLICNVQVRILKLDITAFENT